MQLFVDVLSWVLMVSGSLLVLVGGIGVLRMPTFYARLHASSLTDSAGTILVLIGIMVQAGWSLACLKVFAALVFLVLTGPTATYALASAAVLAGLPSDADVELDDVWRERSTDESQDGGVEGE